VGKRNLALAIKQYPNIKFKVTWYPYFINETIPKGGFSLIDFCQQQLPHDAPRITFDDVRRSLVHSGVIDAAVKVGITFKDPKDDWVFPTMNAHRLIEYVKIEDIKRGNIGYENTLQTKLMEILFKVYFEETKDIGSIDILLRAAEEVGLNKQSVKEYLESNQGCDQVEKYFREALEDRDIQDVPHFTIYRMKKKYRKTTRECG